MVRRIVLAAVAIVLPLGARAAEVVETPQFQRLFAEAGTQGTMVVHDLAKDTWFVTNPQRARAGYLPASTFKIVNALLGLQTGAVRDKDETFASDGAAFVVDGKPLLPPACTGLVTLGAAFRNSCIPVYQEVARRVGRPAFDAFLTRVGYGNASIAGVPVDRFWLEGDFRISAEDQVRFLGRLVRNDLPLSSAVLAEVKDMMVVEAGNAATIRAKTGYAYAAEPRIGWWVGWVEREGGTMVFALNLDVGRPEHLKARMDIARAILKELGGL